MKFKSQLVTQASGSLGGITFAHNKGGMYMRSRAIPTNPNSPEQAAVRGFLSELSTSWNGTLTQAQRDTWINYALNVPVIDRLGESIYISGLAHYLRSNVPRIQAALSIITDAPLGFTLPTFANPTFTIDPATDEVDVAFAGSQPWKSEVGGAMLVSVSRPQSPTINYFKGPYRFAGAILGAVVPPTTPQTIALPFVVSTGQKLFFKVRTCRADGGLSNTFLNGGVAP